MTVHPSGDPGAHGASDPRPLPPRFRQVPAHPLTIDPTDPDKSWWALDGWAVPFPFIVVLGEYGESYRQAIFGAVQDVGLFVFQGAGPRIVVRTERQILVYLPDAPEDLRVQTVLPHALAADIRKLPKLPPVPGAPPVV